MVEKVRRCSHELAPEIGELVEDLPVPRLSIEIGPAAQQIRLAHHVAGGAAVGIRADHRRLFQQRVHLEGMLLKPNMVLSGTECEEQAGVEQVAEATVRCLRRTVPASMPGVVFLSGGQSDELATAHLSEMNKIGGGPWELSFSYGRALQAAPLKAWGGKDENVASAKKAFLHRARCNGAARYGKYTAAMEST